MENNQPIIVKRVKKIAAGHHGGAWKVAFADFCLALLCLFLVLWLLASREKQETAEQLRILGDMGCSYAQGWLIGRPVSLQDVLAD